MKKNFRDLFTEAERDPVFWTEKAILRATEEIFLAMEREKVSRAELARRLGTSPAYVTKVLRGNVNFTLATLARIAYALEGEFKFHISPRDMRTRWFDSAADAGRPVEIFRATATLQSSTRNRVLGWPIASNDPGWIHVSTGVLAQGGKVQKNAAAAA